MSPEERIGFGKYRGQRWADVDIDYLLWVEQNHNDPEVANMASYWIVERSEEADEVDRRKEYKALSVEPLSDAPSMMLDEKKLEKLNMSEAALMVIAAFGDKEELLIADEIKSLANRNKSTAVSSRVTMPTIQGGKR